MKNGIIHIVVPVYNVEAYLERCVESILNQTYDNYKLILVDDGSPDNCPAICDRYAEQYDHITVIHQKNSGISATRNTGIEYVLKNGNPEQDWISFIDSDDFVHPKYLEYLCRAAEETGMDIISCSHVRTNAWEADSSEIDSFTYVQISPEAYWCKHFMSANVAWGKLYRLFLFREIRYPAEKIFEDSLTTHKVLFQYSRIAIVELPLYYHYLHSTSITGKAWSPKNLDRLEALESQITYFAQHNFPEARRESTAHLLQHCIKTVMYIKHLSPRYDHLLKPEKNRRNRAMRLYIKEVGLKRALRYWYLVRIKQPMKRVLKKETLFSFLKRKINKKFFRR